MESICQLKSPGSCATSVWFGREKDCEEPQTGETRVKWDALDWDGIRKGGLGGKGKQVEDRCYRM